MEKSKATPEEWGQWQADLDKEMIQCVNDTAQGIDSDHVSKERALDIAETCFERGSLAASRIVGSLGENTLDRRFFTLERSLQDTAALLKGIELQLDNLQKSKSEGQGELLKMAKSLIDRIYPEPKEESELLIIHGHSPQFDEDKDLIKIDFALERRRSDITELAIQLMPIPGRYPMNSNILQSAINDAIKFYTLLKETVK